MLHDSAILNALTSNDIEIDPFDENRIQPSSYDFTLGDTFILRRMTSVVVNPKVNQESQHIEVTNPDVFTLKANQCCLAVTRERVRFGPYIAGRLEGKSSVGRLFLSIHITAGFFDPGFDGYPTLELVNHNPVPIMIFPGMPIAQMSFFRLEGRPTKLYGKESGSKYQNQGNKPVISRYHKNFPGDENG